MINRLIGSIFFVSALFALSLALLGVDEPIQLAPAFRSFIVNCNKELENFKFAIPNIDFRFDTNEIRLTLEGNNIFTAFIDFVVGFYGFLNFLLEILNFIVMAINTIIALLQFIFIFLKNIVNYRDSIIESTTPLIV